MSVRFGSLNTLLRLDKDSATTQGDSGYITPVWNEQARIWCNVTVNTGTDAVADGAEQWNSTLTIEARWDSRMEGITPGKWRLTSIDRTIIYDILEAHDVNLRHEKLLVTARRGSAVPT